jgi:hypothetical protein
MKSCFLFALLSLLLLPLAAQPGSSPAVRWYLAPEGSLMLHGDHAGRALGFQTGVSVLRARLQIGFFYYGRSGPINPHTETLALPVGQTYKGQQTLSLRADHGAFGLMLAPQFPLAQGRLILDIPLAFGQMGAGFYLTGENRDTPDGRRVSAWENELMDGQDAAFGYVAEGGLRVRARLGAGSRTSAGLGIHYARTLGWSTAVGGTDYYHLPRISMFMQFGN